MQKMNTSLYETFFCARCCSNNNISLLAESESLMYWFTSYLIDLSHLLPTFLPLHYTDVLKQPSPADINCTGLCVMRASLCGLISLPNMSKPPLFLCTPFIKMSILKNSTQYYFELNMSQYGLKAHLNWKVLFPRHVVGKYLF